MWIIQGTLAWRTPPVRIGVWNQTYPQEDRWGDSGEIQCRSNFLFTRGIRAVRGGTNKAPLFSRGVTPDIAVKARRVGGSTHQVPIEIGSTQGKALAIRWLLGASRKRPGRNMAFKLSSELVDAAKGSGDGSWINENVQKLYLPLPFYESLPFCVWHRHSLWQHLLIRNFGNTHINSRSYSSIEQISRQIFYSIQKWLTFGYKSREFIFFLKSSIER